MADEADDLDYSESNVGLAQAQGVRKNISLKLKGKGRGRGRRGGKVRRGSSKKVSGNTEDEVEEATEEVEEIAAEKQLVDSNLEDVISKLETPAFSPMDRTFPEPLHQNKKLRWDHKVNLIGEKVIDPLIHCCEKCSLPILNYGRLIPCKHVFCYDCAKKSDKVCPKCDEKIQRTEPSALGTVFMCTFGGSRHTPGACGRTYLSQRDLQAHINHRHMKPSSVTPGVSSAPPSSSAGHVPVSRDPRDPRGSHLHGDQHPQAIIVGHLQPQQDHAREPPPAVVDHPRGSPASQQSRSQQYPPHSPASYASTIPVSSARPNLITVPIQDDGVSSAHSNMPVHAQSHVPTYATSVPHQQPMPPPQQQPPYGAPYQQQQPQPQQSSGAYSSQAPPITTLTFSQPPPPVGHHGGPPQLGAGGVYSAPPPPPVHHGAATYGGAPPPRAPPGGPPRQQPMHPPPPPPQRFHEEGTASYMGPPQWGGPPGSGGVPPPPSRASLPARGPIGAPPPPSGSNQSVGLLATPRGPPADSAYRQPYYQ